MDYATQSNQTDTTDSTQNVRSPFCPSERMTQEIRQHNQAIHRHERESGDYASPDALTYFQAMAAMMVQ